MHILKLLYSFLQPSLRIRGFLYQQFIVIMTSSLMIIFLKTNIYGAPANHENCIFCLLLVLI